jgi:hypothetical protein
VVERSSVEPGEVVQFFVAGGHVSRPGADDLKETALLGVYVTSKERREERGARD